MGASQFVNSGNDIISDREALPGAAVAATTGAKVHEVVRTLGVESGAESNAGDGTGFHGVIRKGFKCKMDVITKIEAEMGKVEKSQHQPPHCYLKMEHMEHESRRMRELDKVMKLFWVREIIQSKLTAFDGGASLVALLVPGARWGQVGAQ